MVNITVASRALLRKPLRRCVPRGGGIPPPLRQQPGRGSDGGAPSRMQSTRGTSAA